MNCALTLHLRCLPQLKLASLCKVTYHIASWGLTAIPLSLALVIFTLSLSILFHSLNWLAGVFWKHLAPPSLSLSSSVTVISILAISFFTLIANKIYIGVYGFEVSNLLQR